MKMVAPDYLNFKVLSLGTDVVKRIAATVHSMTEVPKAIAASATNVRGAPGPSSEGMATVFGQLDADVGFCAASATSKLATIKTQVFSVEWPRRGIQRVCRGAMRLHRGGSLIRSRKPVRSGIRALDDMLNRLARCCGSEAALSLLLVLTVHSERVMRQSRDSTDQWYSCRQLASALFALRSE